ncbi:MAG: hypothetical protein H6Q52_2134 [Deltaproteobacteria bacterium]|nr:hypothetical protein [Deltaproteobacteria bacterium]
MGKSAKNLAIIAALLILVLFIVFVINQTILIVAFADRFHPIFGSMVLGILVVIYAACIFVPVYFFLRMPSPAKVPRSEDDPEFPAYLNDLAKRLGKNSLVAGPVSASKDDIEAALKAIDKHADEAIKKTAARIFISTAISQNGKLDGIIVLAAQSKLVFDIARSYYQRPTVRNLLYLYANVAAMVFFATELEDMDLSETIQPILAGVLGSASGAIPGFQVASMILVSSVISGSSNAYLTLRVGAMTKHYCRSLTEPSRRAVRHYATVEATKMLGSIVAEGSKRIYGAIWTSSQSKMESIFSDVADCIRKTGAVISKKIKTL